MISVTVSSNGQVGAAAWDELRRELDGFSARRMNAAVATALTRTARSVQTDWRAELQRGVDRPTPMTTAAPLVTQATATSLVAEVRMRDSVAKGTPPSQYLQPLEYGGVRAHKKFELSLMAQGSMPRGSFAVPTEHAQRDSYGNVSRRQLVQILVQLAGGVVRDGYRRVISASAVKRAKAAIRAGKSYVAVLERQGKLQPGIYARQGNELRMVFAYERSVRYTRQLSLIERARRKGQEAFRAELSRAIEESAARLQARGGR